MPDPGTAWVTDTSVYTHLSRAGHLEILKQLAPDGLIIVPAEVNDEITAGRGDYAGIVDPVSAPWVRLAVLSDDEVGTQLVVKAALGGGPRQHLGECAVIACAKHRGHTALLDERRAITQAELHGVPTHDTLWLVVEAYTTVFAFERDRAIRVVDDLIATGMYLPIDSGESLFAWAYENGLLPKQTMRAAAEPPT